MGFTIIEACVAWDRKPIKMHTKKASTRSKLELHIPENKNRFQSFKIKENLIANPMKKNPILYIKSGCSWCDKALTFFGQHGVTVDVKDVLYDKSAMQRMIEISGQTMTPTFEYNDFVVTDFSTDEFIDEL